MQFGPKKLFSLAAAFFLAWLGVRLLLPLFAPFLFGAALAVAAEPLVNLLSSRMGLPRSAGAGIGVSITFFLLCTLLLLLGAFVLRELRLLALTLPDLTLTVQNAVAILQNWLLGLAQSTPESIRPLLQENVTTLFSSGSTLLEQAARYLLGLTGNLLSHIPNSALTVGTALLSAFMISSKLPRLRRSLINHLSKERLQSLVAAWRRIKGVLCGFLTAQVKLMGITFLILFIGFLILRIPRPLLWAAGVSLVDAFPVLGTGTILIPWSIIRFLQADTARAIGLAGIYIVISLVRSTLEPKLVGSQLGLDPLLTLIALYAGFKLWGIGGMLLAPLLTVTAIQILPERRS